MRVIVVFCIYCLGTVGLGLLNLLTAMAIVNRVAIDEVLNSWLSWVAILSLGGCGLANLFHDWLREQRDRQRGKKIIAILLRS